MEKNQMKKHYEILGLKEDGASQEEIQIAYERLYKEYQKVQEAYKALRNSSILATDKGARIGTKDNSSSKPHLKKQSNNLPNPSSIYPLKKIGIILIINNFLKNLIFFIISVPLNKLLIHYIFYPILTSHITGSSPRKLGYLKKSIFSPDVEYHRSEEYREFVGEHLKVLFDDQLMLFIPAIILSLLLIWFFNNYKKKAI